MRTDRCRSGQATVEWVALITLVAGLLAALLLVAGVRVPGFALAETIAARLLCAADLGASCSPDSPLVDAYGEDVAMQVRRHAPTLRYERGMRQLPVDFRRCRSPQCADGKSRGVVWGSHAGEPVTAFVHVVDCRPGRETEGAECGAERSGNLYLQYWLYYPDSATLRGVPVVGEKGYHRDDWESYMVRIGPGGVDARSSSHHGYNHEGGARNWSNDAGFGPGFAGAVGLRPSGGWGRSHGTHYVSGGSHAGHAREDPAFLKIPYARMPPKRRRATKRLLNQFGLRDEPPRRTPRSRIVLIPIESLEGSAHTFAVTPPWLKRVYRDPEHTGTD